METMTLPAIDEVRFPNDPPRERGDYVKVVAADADWVEIECHYGEGFARPQTRRIRLSTFLERYSQ